MSVNSCVISNTMRMEVSGARTTAPRQALIATTLSSTWSSVVSVMPVARTAPESATPHIAPRKRFGAKMPPQPPVP